MKKNSFRDLDAYIEGKELVKGVYALLKKFPKEEQYAMCDQPKSFLASNHTS